MTPWPGVPGLHILQCNRIGYRHWSLSQCSCQLDHFQKTSLSVRSWVMEIQGSCLEESIRGSMAPVFNASWCVQTFQVYLMILNHPGGYMSSRCVHSRCVHSRWIQGLQVCPPYKASMWVQAIQVCPGELHLGVSIYKTEWNLIIKCNFSVHSSIWHTAQ